MKMFQVLTCTLLTAMVSLILVTSCPLPEDTCMSLPEDTISYSEYLNGLSVSPNYVLQLNASRTDLAFHPGVIRSAMATASRAVIRSGCSNRNFNFSIVDGADGALDLTCPFQFVCDYNPQRVPSHIFHARCLSNLLSDGTKCLEVFYPLVTMTTKSCDPLSGDEQWLLRTEFVAASCIAGQ